jgi:hypothetical protein
MDILAGVLDGPLQTFYNVRFASPHFLVFLLLLFRSIGENFDSNDLRVLSNAAREASYGSSDMSPMAIGVCVRRTRGDSATPTSTTDTTIVEFL